MTRAALVALMLLGACGDDHVDLTGIYAVTSNVASMPCGADMPVTNGPAYLKFHQEEILGAKYFVFDSCRDAAATDCDTGGLFDGLFEPIDNGWKGRGSSSSHSGTHCVLGYTETSALLNGSHLVIEDGHWSDDGDLPEDQCTTDEAEKRNTSMGCDEHAHIEAEAR